MAVQNIFIGGSVEGLTTGISICVDSSDTNCNGNTFSGIDLEANTNDMIIDNASGCQFNNVLALSNPKTGKNVIIKSKSRANQFIGGTYSSIEERGQYNTFMNMAVSSYNANFDSWKINAALINVRDLSSSSVISYTSLPSNTIIGQIKDGIKNAYRVTTTISALSAPSTVPGSVEKNVYIDSNMTQAIAAGATVSVGCVDGVLPANYMVSGYVNPATPTDVQIRWTQLYGAAVPPPSGNYKVTVIQ